MTTAYNQRFFLGATSTASTEESKCGNILLGLSPMLIPENVIEDTAFYNKYDFIKHYPQIEMPIQKETWIGYSLSLFKNSRNLTKYEQDSFRKVRMKRGKLRKLDF